jgi:hypothetical protein
MPTTVASGWECCSCHTARSKPETRLPAGWKRKADEVFCESCWRERYLLRAITVPVVSPLDQSWPEFHAVMRDMWATTTQACNWMLTEFFVRDIHRNGEDKMPPMPTIYLYPEARQRFPALPSGSISALEQQVKAKYRAKRYEIIWTCASSLPTYRYPTPMPVPNQGWSLCFENESPVVSLRIGDARIRLRLKGGYRYRRQLTALRDIAAGEAVQGQLDLYYCGQDVLCKVVAWLPRKVDNTKPATGTLYVRTSPDALVVSFDSKADKLWTYHGDHIRRWVAKHRTQLQRWADDSKLEHRPKVPFAQRRAEASARYHDRMHTACHQIAAMIAGYARRRYFATVEYRDADTSFCPDFSWFSLRQLIREKCDALGLAFEYANGDEKPDAMPVTDS